MKINVLVDNNTIIDRYFLGEPALSFYIEDTGTKILFDTGYSDSYISNAEKMGIDLCCIDKLVISHGHDDHTRGLKFFPSEKKNIELIAHPDCFNYKEDENGLYIGSPFSKDELKEKFILNLSDQPVKISDNLTFLGKIPGIFDFEKRHSIGKTVVRSTKQDDYLEDDSAIVYKNSEGIFVITGCAHSGICSIIEYAKQVCNESRVLGVIGGFHLFNKNERLYATIKYFKENKIKHIYPCHCVSLAAKIEMGKELDINEVGVGLEVEM